jgi:hypothetical protein
MLRLFIFYKLQVCLTCYTIKETAKFKKGNTHPIILLPVCTDFVFYQRQVCLTYSLTIHICDAEFPRRIQLEASDYRATIRLHFPL